MKRSLSTIALMLFALFIFAQDELYLTFEFMKVKEVNSAAYLETESFWEGIHKQRVKAGEIIGWDLWRLEPGGEDQGYQYMTVTLFKSMSDMMKGMGGEVAENHAKKAYPKMSNAEIRKNMDKTAMSRVLGQRHYLSQIRATEDEPDMSIGNVAQIDFMKSKKDTYEAMESMIYFPWHQKMVNDGAKNSWSLLRVLYPTGTESYVSHYTVNMFDNMDHFVRGISYNFGDDNITLDLATEEAAKTRDLRELLVGILVRIVR